MWTVSGFIEVGFLTLDWTRAQKFIKGEKLLYNHYLSVADSKSMT